MYKINDWNINRLFVAYMRIKYSELVKYLSNQGVIVMYRLKNEKPSNFYHQFCIVVIFRCIRRITKRFKSR